MQNVLIFQEMEEDGEKFLKKVDDVNDMIQLLLSTQDKEVESERERGKWAVYYTSPQSYTKKSFLIRWLNNFGEYYHILIGWIIYLSVQTFQPLIVTYRRVNFVHHHWGGLFIAHCLIPLDPWFVFH